MPDDDTTVAATETSTEGTPTGNETQTTETGTVDTATQAEVGSSTTQDQPTSTTPTTQAPPPNPWDSDENPYRKRFNDTLASGTKVYQELQQLKKQYDGIDPELARQALEARKRQEEASKLKPWNKGHESYEKFQAVRSRVSEYQRMLQSADTPEKQALVRELAGKTLRPEEIQQVQEYEADRQQLQAQLHEDPRGFVAELVGPMIQEAIAQFEQFQAARQQTTSWFSDPNNAPLVDRYAPDMYRMMDPSVPARDKAIEMARLKAENDALKARLSSTSETQAHAEAQQAARTRAAQGTVARAPSTTPISDPYGHLVKQGLKPGTIEFAMALQKLNNQG